MSDVFISYRREDAAGEARALYRELTSKFGSDRVFMDLGSIGPGQDFRTVLEAKLNSCNVLIAVIGRNWIRPAVPEQNSKEPFLDYVQLEIGAALKRGITVIPLLIQDSALPAQSELPFDIRDLAFRQSLRLTHEGWDADVKRLLEVLEPLLRSRRIPVISVILSAIALILVLALMAYRHFRPSATQSAPAVTAVAPPVTPTTETAKPARSSAGTQSANAKPEQGKKPKAETSISREATVTNIGQWEAEKATSDDRQKKLQDEVASMLSGSGSVTTMQRNGKTFSIGARIPVAESSWVAVLNDRPISNDNYTYKFNDSCNVQRDGTVEIRGFFASGSVLFEYVPPPSSSPAGTACPSGVLFSGTL